MYRNGIKRLLAVVLSLCGMICLSWLFLILAVAIKLDTDGGQKHGSTIVKKAKQPLR
jgi:lipopolysaccharide/colanic/teichoic acid biosynthesis glycosyltransferase